MDTTILSTALALFAVVFVGALPPMLRRVTERGLHQFVSVAAGILLGSLFLHLLPEMAGAAPHAVPGTADAHDADTAPWIALLAGFLLLFVVERVWLAGRAAQRGPHALLLSATFVGLVLHSLSFGLGFGAYASSVDERWPFLLAILAHKGAEAFSLASVMSLAGLARRRSLPLLGLFALVTPLGLFGGSALAGAGEPVLHILEGFACGTFLYVAVCDLLPEVFHDTEQSWTKLGWVLLGVGLTSLTLPPAEAVLGFAGRTLVESAAMFEAMAPYLLVGFLVAGVLRQVLPPTLLTRHLAGDRASSVVKASLIGAPLPLCSCSVLPVAVSLRRSGASKGATSSFLIATPETGVDSVSVTWALLDPLMTLLRPIGAVLSALVAGLTVNAFVRSGERPGADAEPGTPVPEAAACCADGGGEPAEPAGPAGPAREGLWSRALHFGFVEMLDDLAGVLVVGVLLSGLLSAALPADFFATAALQGWRGLVAMLVLGIPIYVCAAASTPIAASMILKGLSPGAALVFLLASPATNLASLVALAPVLGKRVLAVHLGALAFATLALGAAVDWLYPALGIVPSAALGGDHAMLPGWMARAGAILLGVLILASLVRTRASGVRRRLASVAARLRGRPRGERARPVRD